MGGTYPIGVGGHHDTPLANLMIQAFNTGQGYIGGTLFPAIPVGKQSDKYYVIDPDTWLMGPANDVRAPKTKARKVEWKISSDSYFADNHALSADNALEDLANADVAIGLRENTTRFLTDQLLKAREIRIANKVTSGTNCGSYVTLSSSVTKWTATKSADILSQVTTATAFIRQRTGLRPTHMIMDADSYELMRKNELLRNHFQYVSGGLLTDDQLRSLFGIPNIMVSDAIYNPMDEGETASRSNIWGANCLLAHVGPAMGRQAATFGMGFRWTPAGFPAEMQVLRSIENGAGSRKVEVLEAGYFQDEKIVASELGYLIGGTR